MVRARARNADVVKCASKYANARNKGVRIIGSRVGKWNWSGRKVDAKLTVQVCIC